MIGIYDYTVVLTYLSLVSASIGICVSLSGGGHPYLGALFLLFSGLCDAFDGKVASTKNGRGTFEKRYGIQIDSLSDLVAFGVLPAAIGMAVYRNSKIFDSGIFGVLKWLVLAIMIFYVLAALIRLAYFNVTEEERQDKEDGARKMYTGLPVTSSALIFPLILLIKFISPVDMTLLYFFGLLVTEFLFLSKVQIKKLGMKGILFLVFIGVIEFILLMWAKFC